MSDDGVIKQPQKPVEEAVCKADQVPDRLRVMIARYKAEASILGPGSKGGYSLGTSEVERISDFLLTRHMPAVQAMKTAAAPLPSVASMRQVAELPANFIKAAQPSSLRCRACQSSQITIEHGRYGYYIKCQHCDTNTPIKLTCSGCEGKTRVRKSGPQFFSDCPGCGKSELFHVNKTAPAVGGAG